MSHFSVGVIIPASLNTVEAMSTKVTELLAPYDERKEVALYTEPCFMCKGMGTLKESKLCSYCEGEGQYETTYNPLSKWDWWTVGGRWTLLIPSCWCVVNELTEAQRHTLFALVTPQGAWYAHGETVRDARVTDEMATRIWCDEADAVLAKYADHKLVCVDCHI